MKNISIGLTQYLTFGRLIRNVKVRSKISGYVIYIDKHHCGLSSDLLSKKLGIGLDKVNCTLESTTQNSVISTIKPLT